jgi:hypothetical protein
MVALKTGVLVFGGMGRADLETGPTFDGGVGGFVAVFSFAVLV